MPCYWEHSIAKLTEQFHDYNSSDLPCHNRSELSHQYESDLEQPTGENKSEHHGQPNLRYPI